ncbi:MAG: cytochrome C [Gammaproteobacteria bacterium]|nr:cytochrome C [Gammaproteobacteria bacterium]
MQIFLIAIAILLLYIIYLHREVTREAVYVTSDKCQGCHTVHYDSWRENSLHPYIFLPVGSAGAKILGDFADPAVTFKKEDIEFVIGRKWEQVYARIIDGEYYPFPAKWYVIEKRWVPYKADDWRDTQMSYQCNGCHTTGFDPNTLEFAEFGIGCEACHGPGSLHVQHESAVHKPVCSFCHEEPSHKDAETRDILSSPSASVCGQCHNRGKTPTGDVIKGTQFNFPAGFKPGDDLRDAGFNPSTPKNDKKGKNWWGNGLSKNRHQEFSDWSRSSHSKSLTNLLESRDEMRKKRGKLSAECLHCHSTDYRHTLEGDKPDLKTVKFGITCVACHEPHGNDKKRPGFGDGTAICGACHVQVMANNEQRHTPCPAGQVSCAACHMPYIVKTGGFFSLRSHAFQIILPETSKENNMPNSCQNGSCHADKDLQWAIDAYDDFYRKK